MIALVFKELAFTIFLNITLNHSLINLDDSYNINEDNVKGIENLDFGDDFLLDLPRPDEGLVEVEPLDEV